MNNREKVIEGLEDLRETIRTARQYTFTSGGICAMNMKRIDNAIALIKEQEAVKSGADSGMCEICSFYERALPVKPHYNARTNWYECGACKFSMTSGMHCKGILIPAYKVGFCAKCGKAVEWE